MLHVIKIKNSTPLLGIQVRTELDWRLFMYTVVDLWLDH